MVLSSDWIPSYQYHKVECSLLCVEGRGRNSQSGLTYDIKMGSRVFQCDVPHQWIAQRKGRPRVCILWRGGVSCPVSVAWHSSVAVPLLQAGTIAIWPQMFKSDVKPKTNKNRHLTWGEQVLSGGAEGSVHLKVYRAVDTWRRHVGEWAQVTRVLKPHACKRQQNSIKLEVHSILSHSQNEGLNEGFNNVYG